MSIRDCIDSRDESIRPRLNAVYDTIRFPNSRGLPLELIAEIARWSLETNRK